MKFAVIWTEDAENDLASIWLSATDRGEIASTTKSLDLALEDDPLDCGESRSGNRRVAFILPLGIEFLVFDTNRTVFVIGAWRIDKK